VRFDGPPATQRATLSGRALTLEQLRASRHHGTEGNAAEGSEAALPGDVAKEPPGHGVAWSPACPAWAVRVPRAWSTNSEANRSTAVQSVYS